jgi:SAM-dependent methyltransferase
VRSRTTLFVCSTLAAALTLPAPLAARGQTATQGTTTTQKPKPFEPTVGQQGKDVVWVPTTPEMVEKMLDAAKLTPQDYLMDLGSGDGRLIIAAGKRGIRAQGVEYNPDMVELSTRAAKDAGVADKATFVQGDMYAADISKATVMALFLLPHNLEKLRDNLFALQPGSRIVLNTYKIPGWEPDESETMEGDCSSWCTVMVHYVPAKVAGTWQIAGPNGGQLVLTQDFQHVSGELRSGATHTPLAEGKLKGKAISFTAGSIQYTGQVNGNRMEGTFGPNKTKWTAEKK